MILYANVHHPNLKAEFPNWPERMKQIGKIWKNLPNERRAPFVTRARENRTANRISRPQTDTSNQQSGGPGQPAQLLQNKQAQLPKTGGMQPQGPTTFRSPLPVGPTPDSAQ